MMNYKFFKTIDKLKKQLYITSVDLTDINSEVREKNPYDINEKGDPFEVKDFWDNLLLEFDKLYPIIHKFERRVYMITHKEEIISVKEFLDADLLEEDGNVIYDYLQNYKGSSDTRIKCLKKASHSFSYVLEIIEKAEERLGIFTGSMPISPPRLKTGFSKDQIKLLFDLLVGNFISKKTNYEIFEWTFGGDNNPADFQAIQWEKSKGLLAYFVDIFNVRILKNDGYKRRIHWKTFEIIFNQNNLRGAKNDFQKTGINPIGWIDIDKILDKVQK